MSVPSALEFIRFKDTPIIYLCTEIYKLERKKRTHKKVCGSKKEKHEQTEQQ